MKKSERSEKKLHWTIGK